MRRCAKSSKSVPKPEKVCESVPKLEKVCESVLKVEKVCLKLRKCAKTRESMRKCAKTWESWRKYEKVCQNLRKYAKVCQNLRKLEKVWKCLLNANANADCYLFAYYFWRTVQKSVAVFRGVGVAGGVVEVSLRTACYCIWALTTNFCRLMARVLPQYKLLPPCASFATLWPCTNKQSAVQKSVAISRGGGACEEVSLRTACCCQKEFNDITCI